MALRHAITAWFERLFGTKRALGQRGEAVAARYLRRKGYKIIAHGDRARLGEIDVVAVDRGTVVFVEVKTRRAQDTGNPAEAVDGVKQRQLTRLAVAYLRRYHLLEHPARFDVIAVTWPETERRPVIEHIENAFDAVGQREFYS
jgi:putative endonuclease